MKNYISFAKTGTLICVFISLLSCHQIRLWKNGNQNSKSVSVNLILNDTLRSYFELRIDNGGSLRLSQCLDELIIFLSQDSIRQELFDNHFQKVFNPNISDLIPKEAKYVFWNEYVSLKKAINEVHPELRNLDAYCRLEAQLDSMKHIPLPDSSIINLMHKFERADGAMPWELSSIYFSLLMQQGTDFIDIIRQDEKATELYIKWIKNIERYKFVAFLGGNPPPQIIERQRAYLLQLLDEKLDANEVNKLTYNSIKYAKLRMVN